MTSLSTDIIPSNLLKEITQRYFVSPIEKPCLYDQQHNDTHDINTELDYWHYNIGINVIPVNSKNKITFVSWKNDQSNPITDKQHETRKKNGDYKEGIAALAGKIWRGSYKDKHLVIVDLDNKNGIDEFIEQCSPNLKTLEELTQQTIVEQHSDNKDKAHVYFIVEKPLINRGSINGTNNHSNDDSIPIIEIKSHGKSFVICLPSVHKNGFRYEIIGTREPMVLDKNQSEQLQEHINQIYKKYGEADNKDNNGLIPIDYLLKEDYISNEGSRHSDLLRVMESNIQRSKEKIDLEGIKRIGCEWNQKHCKPPLENKEVERQWESALKFTNPATNKINSSGTILENPRYMRLGHNSNYLLIPFTTA